MDPSWPYTRSSPFYLQMRQNINIGQAERPSVNEFNSQIQTFSSPYSYSPCSSTSRETSSPIVFEEDSQMERQTSNGKKYDKWTNEQQRYLVQLWAEKQDKLNSNDSRIAWCEITEVINSKFATNKTINKCIRKMKYLINAYKGKKDWNKNQTGGNLRKSAF